MYYCGEFIKIHNNKIEKYWNSYCIISIDIKFGFAQDGHSFKTNLV